MRSHCGPLKVGGGPRAWAGPLAGLNTPGPWAGPGLRTRMDGMSAAGSYGPGRFARGPPGAARRRAAGVQPCRMARGRGRPAH